MSEPAPVKRQRASILDVAQRAGVSAQTVSRVARNEATVTPETTQRVRAAMRELGYVPNRAAQALRSGASKTIGIVGHRLTRTGEAHIIEAVTAALRQRGYAVVLADASSNRAEDFTAALASVAQTVDGLVVLRLETHEPALVQLPSFVPIVLGDFRYSRQHTAVGTDQAGGTTSAVEYLLGLGHETVHFVAGPESSVQANAREQAWIAALWKAGRSVPPLIRGDWSSVSGYAAAQQLLADPGVTAVLCANDEMALGLMRACHEAGRAIPQELSIVGFDDVSAEWAWPPLTTVAQDFHSIGVELVDALMGQLAGQTPEPRAVLIPTSLVIRESAAPPRG